MQANSQYPVPHKFTESMSFCVHLKMAFLIKSADGIANEQQDQVCQHF